MELDVEIKNLVKDTLSTKLDLNGALSLDIKESVNEHETLAATRELLLEEEEKFNEVLTQTFKRLSLIANDVYSLNQQLQDKKQLKKELIKNQNNVLKVVQNLAQVRDTKITSENGSTVTYRKLISMYEEDCLEITRRPNEDYFTLKFKDLYSKLDECEIHLQVKEDHYKLLSTIPPLENDVLEKCEAILNERCDLQSFCCFLRRRFINDR